jgi:predicted ATPase
MIEDMNEGFYGPRDPMARHEAHFQISGFRSLHDFQICLKPGLNVLLGANGSGKTNFIEFLDFITNLVRHNSATAVSEAGGVARVFSQESLKKKIPRVTARIRGLADLEPFAIQDVRKRYFKFEYEVDIRYSKFHTSIYIANEKIKFRNLHTDEHTLDADGAVGSLEIHRKTPLVDDDPRWTFGHYLVSNSSRNPLRYVHAHRMIGRSNKRPEPGEARLQLLSQAPAVAPDESILSARIAFPALEAVRYALSRGRSFNLNPQRARTPDDISKIPVIEADGAGLSSTIYQMQQAKRADFRPTPGRRRFQKDSLETIIAWTQIVIPDLKDITATADPHTGKYLVYLHVGDESLKIPLQSASDGTLKWLAFVCLAVSPGAEYTFEEPENFLHPKMQQYLISLLRDSMDDDIPKRYIISTHSETIINQCHPDELILFYFDGGKTMCKNIENSEAVIKQVNETGFGLGHYYAQNVLR